MLTELMCQNRIGSGSGFPLSDITSVFKRSSYSIESSKLLGHGKHVLSNAKRQRNLTISCPYADSTENIEGCSKPNNSGHGSGVDN